jgi:hypothetical protein
MWLQDYCRKRNGGEPRVEANERPHVLPNDMLDLPNADDNLQSMRY